MIPSSDRLRWLACPPVVACVAGYPDPPGRSRWWVAVLLAGYGVWVAVNL